MGKAVMMETLNQVVSAVKVISQSSPKPRHGLVKADLMCKVMQPIAAWCDLRENTCPHLAQPEMAGISTPACLLKAKVLKVTAFNITDCRFCSPTTG